MRRSSFLDLFPEFHASSWDGWRSVCQALDAEPIADVALVGTLTGRTVFPSDPVREAFLIAGRGCGKSRISAVLAVRAATATHYRPVPGENLFVVVMAPDRRQAKVTLNYCRGLLKSIPEFSARVVRETQDEIELDNKIVLTVQTADFRAVRGRSVVFAIVEESAFLSQENSASPDTELMAGLRPALARVPGSRLLVISSPYRRTGILYDAWRDHFGKDDSDTLIVVAPTLTLNPLFDQRAIAKAREEDPAAAASEFDGVWRSDISGLLTIEVVRGCTHTGVFERPRERGITYRAGLDFSGGSGSDRAAVAIALSVDFEGRTIDVLDAVLEMRPPFSPEVCCDRFADLCKRFGVFRAVSDKFAGSFPGELMRKRGVMVDTSAAPKSSLYVDLASRMNSQRIVLLDTPGDRLGKQLVSLERRLGSEGRERVDAPTGAHEDLANAAALVLTSGSFAGPRPRIRSLR